MLTSVQVRIVHVKNTKQANGVPQLVVTVVGGNQHTGHSPNGKIQMARLHWFVQSVGVSQVTSLVIIPLIHELALRFFVGYINILNFL